ncbi:hypothetical protein Tco_0452141 [Tanacetum coccineum]
MNKNENKKEIVIALCGRRKISCESRDEEIRSLKAQLLVKEMEGRGPSHSEKGIVLDVNSRDLAATVRRSESKRLLDWMLWSELVREWKLLHGEREEETSSARRELQENCFVVASLPEWHEAVVKAIEKGMQDGLAAGITHGQEGRVLTDVAAFNPSAEDR